jgi:hypothetical protein
MGSANVFLTGAGDFRNLSPEIQSGPRTEPSVCRQYERLVFRIDVLSRVIGIVSATVIAAQTVMHACRNRGFNSDDLSRSRNV